MKKAKLLFLAIVVVNYTNAFVSNRKQNIIVSASSKTPHHHIAVHRSSKSSYALSFYSLVSSETDKTTQYKSYNDGIIKNTVFPTPKPITDEELHNQGLPILVEAAKHAKAGRTMCTELPENGCVNVSYRTVLSDSTTISEYITSVMKKDNDSVGDFVKPRTVAHLTEPGSEYLSSMWGVSMLHCI
jgi:hypothetical protein